MEARIARTRINKQIATETVALYNAMAAVAAGDKDSIFKRMIENLNGE